MSIQSEVRQQMFMLIAQWQQSGLTQKAYCQQQSIKYHVFHYWYKCYREEQSGVDSSNSTFVKLQMSKPVAIGAVEIHFSNGTRLLFHEPVSSNYLKALVS
jgi:transposase-like protein